MPSCCISFPVSLRPASKYHHEVRFANPELRDAIEHSRVITGEIVPDPEEDPVWDPPPEGVRRIRKMQIVFTGTNTWEMNRALGTVPQGLLARASVVGLPTNREVWTVNASPHVNKKARNQFEQRTYRKLYTVKGLSEYQALRLTSVLQEMATLNVKISIEM